MEVHIFPASLLFQPGWDLVICEAAVDPGYKWYAGGHSATKSTNVLSSPQILLCLLHPTIIS